MVVTLDGKKIVEWAGKTAGINFTFTCLTCNTSRIMTWNEYNIWVCPCKSDIKFKSNQVKIDE